MKNGWNSGIGTEACGSMSWAVWLLTLGVLLAPAERAAAYPVTFEFAGEVASFGDTHDLLGGAVEVGSPFSGSFTFESTTPDSRSDSTTEGFYADAISSFTGLIGGLPFGVAAPLNSFVRVRNNAPGTGVDSYEVSATVDFVGSDIGFVLGMADSTHSLLTTDALPLFPPLLAQATDSGFGFGAQEIGVSLSGPLTALVPEPGTLLLMGVGALLLAGRPVRRVRKRVLRSQIAQRVVVIATGVNSAVGLSTPAAAQQQNCGCMDAVFVLDITNSMEPALSSMQADLRSVINDVAIPASGGDLRLGLITFNDPGVMAPPDSIRVWSPLTMDINAVLEQVDALVVDQGNHPRPEISDEALREMLLAAGIGSGTTCAAVSETRFDVPFRSHCVKHAILITDDLPGGRDDEFDASDLTNAVARAVEAARDSGIHFSGFFPANRSPSVL